jgi:hypothetical protein
MAFPYRNRPPSGDVISLCGVEILYVEGLPKPTEKSPQWGFEAYPPTES